MNGLDFNLRVLRPWARDPAFYVNVWSSRSDVPSREGPVPYPEIQLYNYRFPLNAEAQKDLTAKIGMIPAFLAEAKENLKESNARDLWVYGEEELRNQSRALASLEAGTLTVQTLAEHQHADLSGTSPELRSAVTSARQATDEFVAWLEKLAPTKTGPSGVGKENYTWYQQNVHFIPYNWDEEVVLLRRELQRAQSSLRLEEHNNRNLPPLEPAADAAAFDKMTHERLDKFVDFLVKQEIIPDKPYIKPALAEEARSVRSRGADGCSLPASLTASRWFFSLTTITGSTCRECGMNQIQARSAARFALQHLGQSRGGFRHCFRRTGDACRPVRRQSARQRAGLDCAGKPRRPRSGLALCAGQSIYPGAGRTLSGRVDAARLGQCQGFTHHIRAVAVSPAARLWQLLHHRQDAHRRTDHRVCPPAGLPPANRLCCEILWTDSTTRA